MPDFPASVSPQARAALSAIPPQNPNTSLADARAFADKVQALMRDVQLKKYDVAIEEGERAGVPCRIFTPKRAAVGAAERLLINFHGGGFRLDSGSYSENIPIAALTGMHVVSALYRMAPEHPFPAAVDDALAVYKDALGTHDPKRIVIYGTSAGGILAGQLLARLRAEKLPMPAAAGLFTMIADWTIPGDSEAMFAANGLSIAGAMKNYTRDHDLADPLMSPLYDDLSSYPPSLLIAGTRDYLLSHTVRFHLALLAAGVDARLAVFEAMPHAHWAYIDAPEADQAFELMARFFKEALT